MSTEVTLVEKLQSTLDLTQRSQTCGPHHSHRFWLHEDDCPHGQKLMGAISPSCPTVHGRNV